MLTPLKIYWTCTANLRRRALQTLASVALVLSLSPLHASADDGAMRGLDEQVQDIKSDVLGIAAELKQLEEKLLYPSDTQVAVFVEIAKGDALELDSVKIAIDGEPAASHIYSFRELEALRKGGVQRLHTGNLPIGEHRIDVTVTGSLPGGEALTQTQTFSFTKDVEPKAMGLTLAGQASGDDRVTLGAW